ncbi:MAG: putative Integrase family protein [Acidimicrobiales bacterium]|nr:putative Integrase family protein [Acidimicrobiales bacterium]
MRGHVRRRGSTWTYVIDVSIDPSTGRRRQRTKGGFATKSAAEKAMSEALAAGPRMAASATSATTLRDYLAKWMEAVTPRLRATTVASYEMAITRLVARLGGVRLSDLTPLAVERAYAGMVLSGGRNGKPLSPKTVRNCHVVLRKALADAERLGLLDRNVASRARPPTATRREFPTWTSSELSTFLRLVADDALYPLWVLLATTGVRRGEALGLRWGDVDLDRATFSVSQTVTTVNNKLTVQPPKADSSWRRISLDRSTVAVLRAHRKGQLEQRALCGLGRFTAADLVFATPAGDPVHPDSVTHRFQALVAASDLPKLRGPHDLRHTWASLALAAGIHPKVVSDRLGHSTIAITIDTYSHVIPNLDADAAETVASQLFQAGNG